MTPQDSRRITHLLTLADLAQDSPTIDIKFCSYWDSLCEDVGKARLLLLIKEHCEKPKTLNDIAVQVTKLIAEQ